MNKVLKHPDREEIIRRLTDGESVRKIVAWLAAKYPTAKHLRLTNPTVQAFRKEHLKLEGKVLQDIQEQRLVTNRVVKEQQRQASLESTNAYQDKINEIADSHLDVAKRILQLDAIIGNRMEYWFNAIGKGDAMPQQADKEMRQYMDRQILLLQQYKKFVEGIADHTVEHTINIKIFNDQIVIFRDVIRVILIELDSDKAIRFMDMINRRLSGIAYEPIKPAPVDLEALNELSENVTYGEING